MTSSLPRTQPPLAMRHARCRTRGLRAHRPLAGIVGAALLLASCGSSPERERVDSLSQAASCVAKSNAEGIDVSVYQGAKIDWHRVKASGRSFGIARLSYGSGGLDSTFARNWKEMKAAGMIRGAYQYFRPNQDAKAQAKVVCDTLGRLGPGDLPAMLDVEETAGQSAQTIETRMQVWLDEVEQCTGKRPMIYTSGWFWNPSVNSTAFGSYPLVVAVWGASCPSLPRGWKDWTFYQYSNGTEGGPSGIDWQSEVPTIGVSCDRDQFNGDVAALSRFAGRSPYAAEFVAQSFPYASRGAVAVKAGDTVEAWIEMRNAGSATWNASTHLALTEPRGRTSPLAGADWIDPSRPARVVGQVLPGDTYRFRFTVSPPLNLAPGRYVEFFGLVHEGAAWFSDPGQGGPPDNQLEGHFDVVATGLLFDAGVHADAAAVDPESAFQEPVDAHPPRKGRSDAAEGAAGFTSASPGGCIATGQAPALGLHSNWATAVALLALVRRWREFLGTHERQRALGGATTRDRAPAGKDGVARPS